MGVKSVEWVHRSLCKDEDPELFFPVGNTGPAASQIEAAKAVCARCPVKVPCLDWAMQTVQDSGVWGGLTEEIRPENMVWIRLLRSIGRAPRQRRP